MWSYKETNADLVSLEYDGKWHTDGKWKQYLLLGRGRASGSLQISQTGGLIERHVVDWQRELCYSQKKSICQQQRFTGKIERVR